MQEEDLLMKEEVEAPQQIGPYQILETIGTGAFATVFKAMHTITMVTVALKCIPKRQLKSKSEFELLQREVKLMRTMDHPFIASLFEVLDDEKNFYIAIEYVENGNLLDYINANKGLQEPEARKIFYQIITTLEYLHIERRVMHRDLKAENVLLDKFFNIRLVDFGLSKAFTKNDPFLMSICGSPAYVSPEIIKEKPYTTAADIWSCGVLLYAMVVGVLPFNGDNITNLLETILSVNPPIPLNLSPELRQLLLRLLNKDPRGRITIQEIKEHPWLADYEDSQIMSDDFGLIKSLKVMDVTSLDAGVLNEMRAFSYDLGGLLQEIKSCKINSRTAAYKILKRQRTIEEINNWQLVRPSKIQHLREEKLPMLSDSLMRQSDGSDTPPSRKINIRQPRLRKRVNEPRKPNAPLKPLSPLIHLV
ncbi:CAMK family protein kinase [Tritrichomonas foetus]|uniref:non-specific serine/threonine protein kinase n=1 Tax=Tritrichomonas foetus TaxID=1144522 RepID=A0A1J4KQI3_9EUKA|nr:CAMK family protein kinase [Tritrichomonas foetus]|eukprot:OHT13370.1 CAMK family protein kinase [Tritrichomonas foetus]